MTDKENSKSHERDRRQDQATRIVEIAVASGAMFYRHPSGSPVVDSEGLGERVVALGGRSSKDWLSGLLYDAEGRAASSEAVRQALRVLSDRASRSGEVPEEIMERMAANAAISSETGSGATSSKSTQLIELALEHGAEPFHDERQEPYVVLPGERRQIWRVRSREVRLWISHLCWTEERTAPSSETLSSALNVLGSLAVYEGSEHQLNVRVGWHRGALFYDLGDWRAIRISEEEWEIVENPPILFRHYNHQLVQVEPMRGGDFDALFDYVAPTRGRHDRVLFGTTTLGHFVPGSPRPAISIAGPQGSGKTTTSRVIKRLVDPSRAKSIRRIADFRELQLQLEQNWLLSIDNITSLKREISDALAAAITGDSDLRRTLYTDEDLLLLDYRRPVVLNGIAHPVEQADLLDRTVLANFDRIPPERRMDEEDFWPRFDAALPGILGGAFDILVKAIANRPSVRLPMKPRMADFASLGYAIADAAGWGGSQFLAAYEGNIKLQHEEAVASSAIAQAISKFAELNGEWQGPASALKPLLDEIVRTQGVDPQDRRSGWPQDAARLGKELRKLAETLGAVGVELTFPARGNKRSICIRQMAKSAVGTVGSVGSESTDAVVAVGETADTDGTDGTDGNFQDEPAEMWEVDL